MKDYRLKVKHSETGHDHNTDCNVQPVCSADNVCVTLLRRVFGRQRQQI